MWLTFLIVSIVIGFVSFIVALFNMKNFVKDHDKTMKYHIYCMIGMAVAGVSFLIGVILGIIKLVTMFSN
jgi:hypothetical protein